MSNKIIVVDFDETLYKHDSLIKFCLYIYSKKPTQYIYVFKQIISLLLHSLKLISTKQFKEMFLSFANGINEDELYQLSIEFWDNQLPEEFNHAILEVTQKSYRTICISASPELYLKYICHKLNVELIGTRIKYINNCYQIIGENCKGEEKLNRLKAYLNDETFEIEECYSDSMTDAPLFNISKNAFLVKGYTIIKL